MQVKLRPRNVAGLSLARNQNIIYLGILRQFLICVRTSLLHLALGFLFHASIITARSTSPMLMITYCIPPPTSRSRRAIVARSALTIIIRGRGFVRGRFLIRRFAYPPWLVVDAAHYRAALLASHNHLRASSDPKRRTAQSKMRSHLLTFSFPCLRCLLLPQTIGYVVGVRVDVPARRQLVTVMCLMEGHGCARSNWIGCL